jgi:hypothetical protein
MGLKAMNITAFANNVCAIDAYEMVEDRADLGVRSSSNSGNMLTK